MEKKEEKSNIKGKYHYAVGKRKSAIAKVKLYPKGKGRVLINDLEGEKYLFRPELKSIALQPLKYTENKEKFDIVIISMGGGSKGQAEAIRLGLAKALVVMDKDLKPILKKQGFLTRDSRVKERKKPGLKKARRAPQWQKR